LLGAPDLLALAGLVPTTPSPAAQQRAQDVVVVPSGCHLMLSLWRPQFFPAPPHAFSLIAAAARSKTDAELVETPG